MPEISLPCRCPNGHKFTESEAADLDFVCDKCDGKIACTPAAPPAKAGAPGGQGD
jgi:hypothetical protein